MRPLRVVSVLGVGCCGAVAGATNAWLCYAGIPGAVSGNPHFAWHLVPAGAGHGAVLAMAALALAKLFADSPLPIRLLAAPAVGWVTGHASWIPLNRSVAEDPWLRTLAWPFQEGWSAALLDPFLAFGLVASLYYACLSLRPLQRARLSLHLLYAILAGVLGSLWWWISMETWSFSVLHGAIWGTLVGTGAWTVSRAAAGTESGGALTPPARGRSVAIQQEDEP